MYIVVANYTTLLVLHWLFNYMALKAMCKYSILLTGIECEVIVEHS